MAELTIAVPRESWERQDILREVRPPSGFGVTEQETIIELIFKNLVSS